MVNSKYADITKGLLETLAEGKGIIHNGPTKMIDLSNTQLTRANAFLESSFGGSWVGKEEELTFN